MIHSIYSGGRSGRAWNKIIWHIWLFTFATSNSTQAIVFYTSSIDSLIINNYSNSTVPNVIKDTIESGNSSWL